MKEIPKGAMKSGQLKFVKRIRDAILDGWDRPIDKIEIERGPFPDYFYIHIGESIWQVTMEKIK